MSGNSGPLASNKGETSSSSGSKTTTKSGGFDQLDINKLFKGKTAEPTAKAVAQKHGMQTLGKVLPARRPGQASNVKPDTEINLPASSTDPALSQPLTNQGPARSEQQGEQQSHSQQPGWTNAQPPHTGPQRIPNAPIPALQSMPDKKWSGGMDRMNGPYATRFAQEFPSLDAATSADPHKGSPQNSLTPVGNAQSPRPPPMSKSQDNQYGPGPILRPQTDWNWNHGGVPGRRPPPPSNQSPNYPPDRPNMGGPTPPPMSLGQGGPVPPPLGVMQFRGMSNLPFMYPNSGGNMSNMGYGMPIPADAPPPTGAPQGNRPPRLNKAPPQPARPGSHFTNKPIIKQEELERMDEIGKQDGGWACSSDDIDYNKKINFSDEEFENASYRERENVSNEYRKDPGNNYQEMERRPIRILEREKKPSISDKDEKPSRDQDRYDSTSGYRGREREYGDRQNSRGKKQSTASGSSWRSETRSSDFSSQSSKYPSPGYRQQQNSQSPYTQSNNNSDSTSINSTPVLGKEKEKSLEPIGKPLERKQDDKRDKKGSRDNLSSKDSDSSKSEVMKIEAPVVRNTRPDVNNLPENEHSNIPEKAIPKTNVWSDNLEGSGDAVKVTPKEITPPLESKPIDEERKPVKILEREKKTSISEKDTEKEKQLPRDRDRYDSNYRNRDRERDRDHGDRQNNRNKKPHPGTVGRGDNRQEYQTQNPKFLPPRFRQQQQQQQNVQPSFNKPQRQTPSPNPPQGKEKEKDKPVNTEPTKLPEKKHSDTESSKDSKDKRNSTASDHDNRNETHHRKGPGSHSGKVTNDETRNDDYRRAPPQQPNKSEKHKRIEDSTKNQKDVNTYKHHEEKRQDEGLKKDGHNHRYPEHRKGEESSKPIAQKETAGQKQAEFKRSEDYVKTQKEVVNNKHNEKDKPKEVVDKKPLRNTGSWADEMEEDEVPVEGADSRKPSNKPSTKQNRTTGGSRLQGYGPPSDRNPFSSNVLNKDDDANISHKERPAEERHKPVIPPPTSGPIPLMALGDISPPEMPPKSRYFRDRDRHPHGPRGSKHGGAGDRATERNDHGPRDRDGRMDHRDRNDHRGGRNESFRGNNRKSQNQKRNDPKSQAENESSNWTKPNVTNPVKPETDGEQNIEKPVEPNKENVNLTNVPSMSPKPQPSAIAPNIPKPISKGIDNMLDSSSNKVPSMVFENTNLKKSEAAAKLTMENSQGGNVLNLQDDKSLTFSSLENALDSLPKQLSMNFAKAPGGETSSVKLDFGSTFDDGPTSQSESSKVFMHSPRPYIPHQPSPVSPLTSDLSENIQAVRSIWENPAPVTEHTNSCASDDSSLNSGFGGDFKRPDSTSREIGQSLQATSTIGYAPGSQNPISVIAKPGSSSSPTGISRLNKQVQQSIDSQQNQQVPLSFSPFGYGMPQQHQGSNTFGGISAIPSPPTAMYAKTAPAPNMSAMYTGYQHPETAHLLSGTARNQFTGYSNVQAGTAPYGNVYMPFDNTSYSAYSHQTASNVVQQAPGAPGSNRISPSTMSMTATTSANAVGGMMSSAGQIGNTYKVGRSVNPNLAHSVHHAPSQQQAYSQMPHHLSHAPHHLGAVGHQKSAFSQNSLPPQSQAPYMVFDPNQQSVLNLTQNYLSSGGMRNAGGPPPSATPPMQGLQSSSFYGSNANQSGYPGGTSHNQTGNLQPLHVAVAAPGPPSLSGPQPHYGMQYPGMNIPGYNSQPNGINLNNAMGRPGGPTGRK